MPIYQSENGQLELVPAARLVFGTARGDFPNGVTVNTGLTEVFVAWTQQESAGDLTNVELDTTAGSIILMNPSASVVRWAVIGR